MIDAHILSVSCPDQKGLVYKITESLYGHGVNVEENHEYVDADSSHFFMRTETSGKIDRQKLLNELKHKLPEVSVLKLSPVRKKDIVILATKEHHCLGDLLIRHHYNDLHANILAVISNYLWLGDLCNRFEIPFHCVEHDGLSRSDHEQKILQQINEYNPEYLVLAKYMRILTPGFIRNFSNRIINIHHSFLPAFVGARPYAQAYNRGVKIIGATAHFVNENLDEGPIIAQDVIEVNHSHNAREMSRAGRDVEKNVLANALRLVFMDRVFIHGNKTIIME